MDRWTALRDGHRAALLYTTDFSYIDGSRAITTPATVIEGEYYATLHTFDRFTFLKGALS